MFIKPGVGAPKEGGNESEFASSGFHTFWVHAPPPDFDDFLKASESVLRHAYA